MIDPNYILAELAELSGTPTEQMFPGGHKHHHGIPTVIPNPPVFEVSHKAGETTLWIVFVIMFISTLLFAGLTIRVPVAKRLFYVITTFITLFATLSYFAMASGDGVSFTHIRVTETKQELVTHIFRKIYWARYVDWLVTTPLLLLDLSFLAGLNGADIIGAIVADIIMILTGLFAMFAAGNESKKWGWYAMACVAYIAIVWIVAVGGRKTAAAKDAKTAKFFAAIGGFTFILWTIYPIVWGLGDGSRVLSVDAEIIAYAVLDVLAKPVFGAWLLFTHAKSSTLSLGGFWSHGLASEGALRLDEEEGA